MTLIDTSAWVEFLRATGSPACDEVERLAARRFAVCDPVAMEVLAGARDDRHLVDLRRLLARGSLVDTRPGDYETAAVLYRTCRGRGEAVRKLVDCLIAAVAIRHGLRLLQSDADFDVLARHTALELHRMARA